jgi:UDP:flavonoid glycosyltransferase YjiC (YdhE family)
MTPAAVATAVDRLLAEQSFRDAAALVARDIAAMPTPDEVAALLAAGR